MPSTQASFTDWPLRVKGALSGRCEINGRFVLNFCGAGYLAQSNAPELKAAALATLDNELPYSQQGRPAAGFAESWFDDVEQVAAEYFARESSIYFPSGYLIGMIGLSGYDLAKAVLLVDKGAHYNLRDAAALTGRPVFEFEHCDAEHLASLIKHHLSPETWPFVITDGLFASTGRIPPLSDYAAAIYPSGGQLFVDEAHSAGVLGRHGRGACELHGVEEMATIGVTMSKAFGASGALIAGDASAIAKMRQSRFVLGSNKGSAIGANISKAALQLAARNQDARRAIARRAERLRDRLRAIGLRPYESVAPIVSFTFKDASAMANLREALWERNISVYHSHYLGSGAGGVIRCSIFADHEDDDIDRLASAIATHIQANR